MRSPLQSIVLISLLFCLCSCSPKNRIEGYVHYRLSTNPTTLDPALIVDMQGGLIAAKLFNGLVRLNADLDVIPDIAENWEITESGMGYLFHLKKGVLFSNNREVTASDIKYSFKRVLDRSGRSPHGWVLEKIQGARDFASGNAPDVSGIIVQDRYTILFRLDAPFSPFLSLLTMTAAYVVPREEVERWGADFGTHPAGTGPFILREWKHNSRLVLAANPRYFDHPPAAAGLVFRIIPEDLTAVTEFELGNLDVINLPAAEYARYRDSVTWKPYLSSVVGLNTYYLGFNCSRSPFLDKRLRQAVALAIDRRKILDTFYERRGRLARGPVPDLIRSWEMPPVVEYDPGKAKRSIRELGASDMRITLYVSAEQEIADIAEIIQSYLKKAGLSVTIRQLEWSAYKEALNRGEADMFWISWWADYPDPENFLFPLFHSSNHGASGNRTRYSNREVDRLVEAGRLTMDPEERSRLYGRAERVIVEESPWVSFWHKTEYTVRQPHLKKYRTYPIYSMDKGLDVY